MSDIFLSYATEDRPRARKLAEVLEAHRCTVFWDRTIRPGQPWAKIIEKELDEARCVVVLWSEISVTKDFVQNEARGEAVAAPSALAEPADSGRLSLLPTGRAPAGNPLTNMPPSLNLDPPKSGETAATRVGKRAHASMAGDRRAGIYGDFDLVNQPVADATGNPVRVPHRVDLSTGAPQPGTQLQEVVPDAVSFKRGLIMEDKPLGRPIMKDRQEIIRAIRAYEASQRTLPTRIAVPRYDPATGAFVRTDLYTPADFLPKPNR